jgi:protease I
MAKSTLAVLIADGFEQSELDVPRRLFEESHLTICIAAPKTEPLRGWHDNNWGEPVKKDWCLGKVRANQYRALVLPGGLISSHTLRSDEKAISLVRDFYRAGKLVAAIGHGVGILISADILKSHKATANTALRADVMNSGAIWYESPLVKDGQIITAQNSTYAEKFAESIITRLEQELAPA